MHDPVDRFVIGSFRSHAITWTQFDLTWPSRAYFTVILFTIQIFSFTKIHVKRSIDDHSVRALFCKHITGSQQEFMMYSKQNKTQYHHVPMVWDILYAICESGTTVDAEGIVGCKAKVTAYLNNSIAAYVCLLAVLAPWPATYQVPRRLAEAVCHISITPTLWWLNNSCTIQQSITTSTSILITWN